jgi:hypothetical protein
MASSWVSLPRSCSPGCTRIMKVRWPSIEPNPTMIEVGVEKNWASTPRSRLALPSTASSRCAAYP